MRDIFKHGVFSWAELATTDVEGAKRFYSDLLGWTTEPGPVEEMKYTLVKAGDERVGGIMGVKCGACEIPPHWGIYITVDDVDATARKAEAIGVRWWSLRPTFRKSGGSRSSRIRRGLRFQ